MTFLRRHLVLVAICAFILGVVATWMWLSPPIGGALGAIAALAAMTAIRRRRAVKGLQVAEDLDARAEERREGPMRAAVKDAAADRQINIAAREAGEHLPPEPQSAPRPAFLPPRRYPDES